MLVWARCKLLSIQVLMIVCILSMYVIVHVAQVARPQESQHVYDSKRVHHLRWPLSDARTKGSRVREITHITTDSEVAVLCPMLAVLPSPSSSFRMNY